MYLFVRHTVYGCFLLLEFTLASGVFACAGVEHDRYSKTSESGVDICEENSEKIQKYLHGRLASPEGKRKTNGR